MASFQTGKLSIKDKGLRYKLLIIESLIFLLPFLILSYIFYRNNFLLEFSQTIVFALTLTLILCGLIILRQIFDRFFMLATLIKKAEGSDKGSLDTQQDTGGLREITVSFNSLMERLEETTGELQCRVFELFSIKELTEVASKSLDIDDLLNLLLQKAMSVSKAQIGSVFMVEPEKQRFRVVATRGLESGPKKGSYFNIKDSCAHFVLSEGKPLLVQGGENDPIAKRPNDPKDGPPSFLGVPIFVREDLIAVLNLSHKGTKEIFNSNIEQILSIMIGEIGFALENAQLHSQVKEHLKNLQERTKELANANNQLQQEIAERKQVEKDLRESEERFRELAELLPETIYEMDVRGNIIFVNRNAFDHFRYTQQDFDRGLNGFDMIAPEDRHKGMENAQKILSGEKTGLTEYKALRKDGSTFPALICSTAILREGKPAGLRGFIIDITEKKRLEAQFQRAQKMGAIGTLAGGVAHDLNNILAGLVSYPELLLMDLPDDSPLRKPIVTIQNSGEKAAAIVQDLLTLARRGVVVTEAVNLNDIISEYMKSSEYEKLELCHPEVDIETNLETSLLPILGSPVQLSKTVMNLVSNAAEAMTNGGRIFISTENRYIDQPIRGYDYVEEGDYVTFSISANGAGISSEDMEKIFEPFYTKKVMGRSGTGIGMAVVWGTVKDHKGYIDVQSREGKGTTFTLYFPVTRKEVATDKTPFPIEDYRGKGESLLVVDDIEEQREIASSMLKKLGYSVTSISTGEEAVEYLKNNSADLLVLDMIMDPGIDGFETYKRILELHPNQKAIIASGFSETDRVKEAQRLGAGAYVKKPYLLEKIGQAVRDELNK